MALLPQDEALYFAFDNDHDGLTETGGDLLEVAHPLDSTDGANDLSLVRGPPEGVVGAGT